MPKLRVHNFLVTLDGYATGDDQNLQAAFGTAQPEFMPWFDTMRIWRDGFDDDELGPDEAIAATWGTRVGADILGRKMYHPSTGPWPDDGWRGWWGAEPPFHGPCFVLTHFPHEPVVVGGTTFHFVGGSPADVLALVTEAADGLDIRLGGGPSTVNEFLAADLVDHLHIILAPIVLGRGVRLWDGLEGLQRRFALRTVASASGATHLFFTR